MLKKTVFAGLSILFFLTLPGCVTTTADRGRGEGEYPEKDRQSSEKKEPPSGTAERVNYGKAAYYSDSARGKLTASGEEYDPAKLTAAHVTLPFGSVCRVTNMANGKTVEVRINDRFSGSRERIILLSYEAASRLDAIRAGVINAKVEVLKTPKY
jgi:rare lipoprotein A